MNPSMNAPDPAKLAAELRDIVALAAELEETYRWLYPSGFSRDSAGERVGASGKGGSPVESVQSARAGVRSKLTSVGRATADARKQLLGAAVRLNEIANIIDDGCEHAADVAPGPRRIDGAEYRSLLAAQGRRRARGEGFGGTIALITSLACAECKNEPRRRGNELGEACYKRRQRARVA